MICDQWDVVVVPFPFTERPGAKRRPALVLSKAVFNRGGFSILAMVTSAAHLPWPGDVAISQWQKVGLSTPCIVRLKLFTLDNRLILKIAGRLAEPDRASLASSIHSHLL